MWRPCAPLWWPRACVVATTMESNAMKRRVRDMVLLVCSILMTYYCCIRIERKEWVSQCKGPPSSGVKRYPQADFLIASPSLIYYSPTPILLYPSTQNCSLTHYFLNSVTILWWTFLHLCYKNSNHSHFLFYSCLF